MRRGDRGSASIEAVIGIPAFILFVALVIAAGRIAIAQQSVEAAAADAARSASIARSAPEAQGTGIAAAHNSLAQQGITCSPAAVSIDTSGFFTAVGTDATVTSTVSCTVSLSDTAIPGLPGSITIDATVTSPIDTYRGRTG